MGKLIKYQICYTGFRVLSTCSDKDVHLDRGCCIHLSADYYLTFLQAKVKKILHV